MARRMLSPEKIAPEASTQIERFHADVVDEVIQAVERDHVVVVGMAQNPFVGKARAALDAAGIRFTYLEYGSYLSQWKRRLAVKLWSGYPTFPQIFVNGTLIGGFSEVKALIEAGTLKALFEEGPCRQTR